MTSRSYSFEERQRLRFRVCELILEGWKKKDIIKELSKNFPGRIYTRENLYKIMSEALKEKNEKNKLLRLVPPISHTIGGKLRKQFSIPDSYDIKVVDVFSDFSSERIIETASDLILSYMKELGKGQSSVHLGLGPGYTTRKIAEALGAKVQSSPEELRVSLHAITPGAPGGRRSLYSAHSAFGCFSPDVVEEEFPMYTDPVVRVEDYPEIKNRPGYKEAFQVRGRIQIIFSTLGYAKDSHNIFKSVHEELTENHLKNDKPRIAIKALEEQHWIGDLQFRPYSSKSSVINEDPKSLRVPTLFEIEDYILWAKRPDKRVVLIVSRCPVPECRMIRAEALIPLLKEPIRAWNCLVVDRITAQKCLEKEESK